LGEGSPFGVRVRVRLGGIKVHRMAFTLLQRN
jgi:hypothetical protein